MLLELMHDIWLMVSVKIKSAPVFAIGVILLHVVPYYFTGIMLATGLMRGVFVSTLGESTAT
jgi:hypothetical protein